ncbi:kgtP [Scenedesmus sp. PABB004]|nr:kgtP [Scenedesmus sp. PABB004]
MGLAARRHHRHRYGAELTDRQFVVLVIAIACGTLLEWYDFFVYATASSYLTKVFFPSNDLAVQQLSFWGVYAVGFISRPLGSILFGHIGDTRGRRITLLLSVALMAVPTVLIGCLPTFAQVGIAAPALLAVLRLVQGLAVGGEFGSAMVYLHEIAPPARKAMVGSIGFVSSMFGCALGVVVVMVVEAIFNDAQMLLFGWRIPFLLSSVSAATAFALRLHMPEPHEFVANRAATIHHNLERLASRRSSLGSRASSRRASAASGGGAASPRGWRRHSADVEAGHPASPAAAAAPEERPRDGCVAAGPAPAAPGAAKAALPPPPPPAPPGGADAAVSIEGLPPAAGHYVPIARLLRKHGGVLLLQVLFEAWVSIGFWTLASWLPGALRKPPVSMPELVSQGMLVCNLMLVAVMQLTAGWAADRGMPRLWSCFAVMVAAAGVTLPAFLGFARARVAGAWLLHAMLMMMLGWVLGLIPATCSSFYPASVRATGFNLGHNIAMSWLGGISPTVVTALVAATGRIMVSPGILLTVAAAVSAAATLVLIRVVPAANRNADVDDDDDDKK